MHENYDIFISMLDEFIFLLNLYQINHGSKSQKNDICHWKVKLMFIILDIFKEQSEDDGDVGSDDDSSSEDELNRRWIKDVKPVSDLNFWKLFGISRYYNCTPFVPS